MKQTDSEPADFPVKPIIASLVPIAFAVLFTWIFPLSIITLTRVGPRRVDAVVDQRVLGVIPLAPVRIEDLQSVSTYEAAANTRGSSRGNNGVVYYLFLVDAADHETLVTANRMTCDDLAGQMQAFTESTEPTLQVWTVPLIGYAAALPLLVGLLFLSLVLFEFGKSLVDRGSGETAEESRP